MPPECHGGGGGDNQQIPDRIKFATGKPIFREEKMYDISNYRPISLLTSFSKITEKLIYTVLRFEVFTAVTMKNAVFWYVMPCGSCKNRRFGGT
jgi:hypothetical protein